MKKDKESISSGQIIQDTNGKKFVALENICDAVILVDTAGRIDHLNPAAERMIGISVPKVRHKPLNEVIRFSSSENPADTIDIIKIVFEKPLPLQLNEIFMRDGMGGECVRVSCCISSVCDNTELSGYLLFIKDLTALYESWHATEKSQDAIHSIFDHTVDGIVLVDSNGIIREWSRGYVQSTGVSSDDALGQTIWKVIASILPPEEQTEKEYEDLRRGIRSQIAGQQKEVGLRDIVNQATGERKTVHTVLFPINISGMVMMCAVSRDLTKELRSREQLRRSEQKLRKSNELLESIMQAVPAPLYVKDKNGKYVQCNELFAKMSGFPKEQVIGKTANEIFPESADLINKYDRLQLEETNDSGIISVYSPETETIIYRNFVMHNGRKEGIIGVMLDVSELKRTERQLTAERNRLQALGDHLPNGSLFRLEIDNRTNHGTLTYLSKTWEKFSGLKMEDTQQNINLLFERIHPDDLQLIIHSDKNMDEQNNFSARIRYFHPNGNTLWLRLSAHRHYEGDFRIFDGFIFDITTQKLAEIELERYRDELELLVKERTEEYETANEELYTTNEELNQYRQQLEQMVEQKTREVIAEQERLVSLSKHLPGGVIYRAVGKKTFTFDFSYMSAYFSKLFGISVEDVMANSNLFYKSIHPDDWLMFKQHYADIYEQGIKDSGVEYRIYTSQGDIKWIHMRASHHIIDDEIHVWDGFMIDITPRMLAKQELKLAKEKAEEADRLKSAFLANVSHEIRTPLNGISGFLQFLTSGDITPELQQEYIQVVNTCSRQLLQLIEDVIDIAKVETNQLDVSPEVTDINRMMQDLQVLFDAELKVQNKDKVRLILDDTSFILPAIIYVDPVRLRQTLSHLINNALKFTHNGHIRFGYKLQPSGMLEFEVEDTGIGIPEDKYEIIFERFRQGEQGNNRIYGGTGIGLSISQSLVQLMGGRMWLQSNVGKGSTFSFTIPYLPIAPDDTCHFDEGDRKTISYQLFADKTVLLVEPGMLRYRYYEQLLAAAGIRVIGTKDPQQLLDHFSSCSNIHAIVANAATVDEISNDLAGRINSIHVDVPLVYLGNVNDDKRRAIGENRNKIIVEEPADYARLVEAVGKVM